MCEVRTGTLLEAETGDEDVEILGVRDGASLNQGSGRRRGSDVSEEICLCRRPAWNSSLVSMYK